MLDYLSEGVLIEIFLRLPAKLVMNFRYVCKSWYSMLTEPAFISKYNNFHIMNKRKDQVMVRHYERSLLKDIVTLHRNDNGSFILDEELILPLDARRSSYTIIDSSGGLTCLYGFIFITHPKHIVIWNPSLGFSKRVLVKPFDENAYGEPIYGFGFDQKSNDHKVVRLMYYHQSQHIAESVIESVEIYAFNVGEWVDISAKAKPGYLVNNSMSRAYVDGAIYWVAKTNIGVSPSKLVLSMFDLSDEKFKTLEMSDELKWGTKFIDKMLKVAAMNESLSLVHFFVQWTKSLFFNGCIIWMIDENGGAGLAWMIKYRVDLRLGIANVIGLRENGEVVLVARHNIELICFPIGSRKIRY